MNYTYLLIDILTIIFPVILSFDKKVNYFRHWKNVFVALVIVGIPFVIWDILFTKLEVWWFNPTYLVGFDIGNLPIEEVLFFVVVPFSCTFIYVCIKNYFPKIKLVGFNRLFYALLVGYALVVLLFGWGGWYSTTVAIICLGLIFYLQKKGRKFYHLPIAFLVALIPFFIVNGVLTGTGLDEPIVFYENLENSNRRFFSIPIEDVLYAFILIAGNIFVFEKLEQR